MTAGGGNVYNPPLQVAKVYGTRRGEEDRGPLILLNRDEASLRLLVDGELVRVQGPRRNEIAVFRLDESVPRGCAFVRDVAGLVPSEIVRVSKLDVDQPRERKHYA